MDQAILTGLTAEIACAYLAHNKIDPDQVPGLIASTYAALSGLGTPKEVAPALPEPAVSIRASIKPDYIVCLEDGKKLKMLKRHLMNAYSMTPEQYRARWGLPADYPMVAPNYAEKRRELAKAIGLGRKPGHVVPKKAA
jgi:predicted transcriptional regulator